MPPRRASPARRRRRESRVSADRCLRDHGGSGRPLVLVPSLINPPHILDLDADTSLAAALTPHAHVLLLDWGPASARADRSIAGHSRRSSSR